MNLDLVLGMSCKNINCLACDQNSSLTAHTASGVLVLLDTATNCQVRYLHLRQNAFSAVNFSPDGKLLVTGEIGYRPAVRVWRVKDGQEVAALYGHEFGIKSVMFCLNTTQIVSVGLEHDNVVNLWLWPEKHRVATNKIVDVIKAVAYSESGAYFVTAGIRHIKFWYPEQAVWDITNEIIPPVRCLYGRPGLLGECKQHTFVDVACGNGSSNDFVYCITKLGGLVTVKATDRLVYSHKTIEHFKANCLKVQDQILFIGFSSGDVHMFNSISLFHLAALPTPTFFRRTSMCGNGVFTLVFNPCTTVLVTAYKNSSMCVWDLRNASKVKQKYVAVYHSKAITNCDVFTTVNAAGRVRETLVTVSSDSTVRLWGLIIGESVCYDRLSILYTDYSPLQPLLPDSKTLDNAGVITAVKVSPDKKFIVTGNTAGSICVYDRLTFQHLLTVLAHNREVTCLAVYIDSINRIILASGSRDRLIHVMDVKNEFQVTSTLNIHSSSITVIMFCEAFDRVNMISCSSDRTLSVCTSPLITGSCSSRAPFLQLSKCVTVVSTPADICLHSFTNQVCVGCQDGYIRILEMDFLQERRIFRGCTNEESQILKLCLDSKGALLLSAASDRTINAICFATGNILMSVTGHTRFVTGLIFTSSGDHVISTSRDGCVFIWHISKRALQKRLRLKRPTSPCDDNIHELAPKVTQHEDLDQAAYISDENLYNINPRVLEKIGDSVPNLAGKEMSCTTKNNFTKLQKTTKKQFSHLRRNMSCSSKYKMGTSSDICINQSENSALSRALRQPGCIAEIHESALIKGVYGSGSKSNENQIKTMGQNSVTCTDQAGIRDSETDSSCLRVHKSPVNRGGINFPLSKLTDSQQVKQQSVSKLSTNQAKTGGQNLVSFTEQAGQQNFVSFTEQAGQADNEIDSSCVKVHTSSFNRSSINFPLSKQTDPQKVKQQSVSKLSTNQAKTVGQNVVTFTEQAGLAGNEDDKISVKDNNSFFNSGISNFPLSKQTLPDSQKVKYQSIPKLPENQTSIAGLTSVTCTEQVGPAHNENDGIRIKAHNSSSKSGTHNFPLSKQTPVNSPKVKNEFCYKNEVEKVSCSHERARATMCSNKDISRKLGLVKSIRRK